MDNPDKAKKERRSWAEKNGGTIYGGGVFILLIVLVVAMTICGEV